MLVRAAGALPGRRRILPPTGRLRRLRMVGRNGLDRRPSFGHPIAELRLQRQLTKPPRLVVQRPSDGTH
jgi:hypothetical protein